MYLSEDEIRKLDREEAVNEGFSSGYNSGYDSGKMDMIINLYQNDVSLEIISKSSGLSISEVEEIIINSKKNNNI